jgi:hypothetical protein
VHNARPARVKVNIADSIQPVAVQTPATVIFFLGHSGKSSSGSGISRFSKIDLCQKRSVLSLRLATILEAVISS